MQQLREAKKIWSKMVEGLSSHHPIPFNPEAYKKLQSIFSVGDYYYYIFNVKTVELEYVSSEIQNMLGYSPSDLTIAFILEQIHPMDVSWFLDFEAATLSFMTQLPINKVMKYKIRYDYRLKKADGTYLRILQQNVAIENGVAGQVIRSLGIHTDITHLKKEGKPTLSFIGLDGEPSYIDVQVKKIFSPTEEMFSNREKEILLHLISGKTSSEIAQLLYISKKYSRYPPKKHDKKNRR